MQNFITHAHKHHTSHTNVYCGHDKMQFHTQNRDKTQYQLVDISNIMYVINLRCVK